MCIRDRSKTALAYAGAVKTDISSSIVIYRNLLKTQTKHVRYVPRTTRKISKWDAIGDTESADSERTRGMFPSLRLTRKIAKSAADFIGSISSVGLEDSTTDSTKQRDREATVFLSVLLTVSTSLADRPPSGHPDKRLRDSILYTEWAKK